MKHFKLTSQNSIVLPWHPNSPGMVSMGYWEYEWRNEYGSYQRYICLLFASHPFSTVPRCYWTAERAREHWKTTGVLRSLSSQLTLKYHRSIYTEVMCKCERHACCENYFRLLLIVQTVSNIQNVLPQFHIHVQQRQWQHNAAWCWSRI